MEVGVSVMNRTLRFSLSGELDECSYKTAKQAMDDAISRYIYDKVVFDFSGLGFMDSTGIGMLIGRYKALKKYGKPCYIENASGGVEKILAMTGIYSIMPKVYRNGGM